MNNQTHTPTVADLAPLVGTWRMDVEFPDGRQGPPRDMGARTVFEYGPGSQFLIQRWEVPHPEAPDGIAIITTDPDCGPVVVLLLADIQQLARLPSARAEVPVVEHHGA